MNEKVLCEMYREEKGGERSQGQWTPVEEMVDFHSLGVSGHMTATNSHGCFAMRTHRHHTVRANRRSRLRVNPNGDFRSRLYFVCTGRYSSHKNKNPRTEEEGRKGHTQFVTIKKS